MPSLEDMTVDQLLAHAKAIEPHANLLRTLTNNPETREMIQRAIKKANPTVSIPELDTRDAVMTKVDALREDNEKLRREIQEKDIRERLERQRAQIRTDYELTDADVLEVEKIMTREVDPIPSYSAAAQVYKASKISATPTPSSYTPPNFTLSEGKDDPWAQGLMANAPGGGGTKSRLDRIGMTEAYKAMNELFGGKVPGLGSAKAN
jgi:hypothetical protein